MKKRTAAILGRPMCLVHGLSMMAATLLAGCLAGAPPRVQITAALPEDKRFPPASELGQIATQPPPPPIAGAPQEDVDSWDFSDASTDRSPAAHVPTTAWERLLAEVVAKRQGVVFASDGMHCLAHQAGLFFLAHRAFPSDDLTRFMAARCGATETQISFAYLTGGGFARMSEEQFFASARGNTGELMAKYLPSGGLATGIWAGREKDKAVVVMPVAPRRAHLDQVPIGPDPSGHVVIRGEDLTGGDRIEAIGNYGRFGFRRCVVDPRVRLPRFSVDCEIKADDADAMIEVAAFAPGRITGPIVAALIVWPSGHAPAHYVRPSYGALPAAGTGSDFPANLVVVLNQVRKEAGLGPVAFHTDESTTAARVAPHYFAAVAGAAPETLADRIVLGLRAGWQIPGLVGYGHFSSTLTRNTKDATGLLVSALNRPSGRETLLSPDIKFVAIGPTISREQGTLAGIFTSYSLLDPATPQEVAEVLASLNAKRRERGLMPATLVDSLETLVTANARLVELGQRTPEAALQELMEMSTGVFASNVQGWVLAADKFERLPFPEDLFLPNAPRVAIGVAHFRLKGSPWGTHGAFIVAAANRTMLAAPSLEQGDRAGRQVANR